jgi:hypothetical protein
VKYRCHNLITVSGDLARAFLSFTIRRKQAVEIVQKVQPGERSRAVQAFAAAHCSNRSTALLHVARSSRPDPENDLNGGEAD